MIEILKKYIRRNISPSTIMERNAVEAYDIWAENYDSQPGNLMLDLDEAIFSELLGGINIKDKTIADIGCGTGRHWPGVLKKDIAGLTGFDVSPGMLGRLKEKFPAAKTFTITDDHFREVEDQSYDLIISTLTVAHIKNITEALQAWSRILKNNGDLIITDFHPDALAAGGQRTFRHGGTAVAVRNFVHPIDTIRKILVQNGFKVINEVEKRIDETVKHYYQLQSALHVYHKFNGFPIIYGIHFRRG